MTKGLALGILLALAGCAAPEPTPVPSPGSLPVPSPGPTPVATPVSTPVPTPAPSSPPPVVVENGTLAETPLAAKRTYEFLFPLNATERVVVNFVFGPVQKPAPYGWSAQVSLRSPDGRIVADSGTAMPETGTAFQLRIENVTAGSFLARVTVSHPTTLTARAYVDG